MNLNRNSKSNILNINFFFLITKMPAHFQPDVAPATKFFAIQYDINIPPSLFSIMLVFPINIYLFIVMSEGV